MLVDCSVKIPSSPTLPRVVLVARCFKETLHIQCVAFDPRGEFVGKFGYLFFFLFFF